MSDEPDLIPARMLNEVVYCPRLYYLEHVAGEWEESADTLSGKRVHRRVDARVEELPLPEALGKSDVARSVTAASAELGIIAKVDIVEAVDGLVVPVDYKRGSAPDPQRVEGGVWEADRVQVASQVLALRAAGYRSDEGAVYYAASKTRVAVPVDGAAEDAVRAAVALARSIKASGTPPPPLISSPKCPGCSLVGICLPDETNALLGRADGEEKEVRRLMPADEDRHPCHVLEVGATIRKSGERLEVHTRDGKVEHVRTRGVSHLSLFGQVHVTTSVIQELCSQGVGVSFHTSGGWHFGTMHPHNLVNVAVRIAQFRVASVRGEALALARAFVAGKILNCRTLLRRNARLPEPQALDLLRQRAEDARKAESVESLRGIEGLAARVYFKAFNSMLAADLGFDLAGRNRRPPRDPVNALLSLAYSLLMRECHNALARVGLDPSIGFLHEPRAGRPALALDLMEEFRPLAADSAVLFAINAEIVQKNGFIRAAGAVTLNADARKAFVLNFERRMRQEITHPIFGYRITYRRVLEVQARLLSRVLLGELPDYPAFLTR